MIYLCRTPAETVGEWFVWGLRIVDDNIAGCRLQRTNKDLQNNRVQLSLDMYCGPQMMCFVNRTKSYRNQGDLVIHNTD